MYSIDSLDTAHQVYLNLMHRYFQGRMSGSEFHDSLRQRWSEDRKALWLKAWKAGSANHCLEVEALAAGERPAVAPGDPRRLPRMLDRLWMVQYRHDEEDAFRAAARDLLRACREPEYESDEANYIRYPPRVNIYERPLPAESAHRYPCTVAEIRAQLATVPEYDLEGLWSIGLELPPRRDSNAYGIYYRYRLSGRRPCIVLQSNRNHCTFKLPHRCDPGRVEQIYHLELRYGIEVERQGSQVIFRWPDACLRRYVLEQTLLHEVGHHVQYQQRWRAGHCRGLPTSVKEQFAEDYALRAERQRYRTPGRRPFTHRR